MRYFGIFSLEMAPILDSATKYLAYIFFVLMLILDLIILYMDSKTAILGQLVHISWLFLLFSDKMAAILDLAIKYLTYSCFVVFVLILELINLYLDTKTTILCQLVIISWLSFSFPMNWWPSWILPGWQPYMG